MLYQVLYLNKNRIQSLAFILFNIKIYEYCILIYLSVSSDDLFAIKKVPSYCLKHVVISIHLHPLHGEHLHSEIQFNKKRDMNSAFT